MTIPHIGKTPGYKWKGNFYPTSGALAVAMREEYGSGDIKFAIDAVLFTLKSPRRVLRFYRSTPSQTGKDYSLVSGNYSIDQD